jgi:hypothetical protein
MQTANRSSSPTYGADPSNGGSAGDPNKIYFTAGLQDEMQGLFGSLTPNSPPSMMMADGSHHMTG